MSDDIDKLPTDMEDGALKPQPPAAAPDSTKPSGPATDAVDAMDEAIAEDRKKADRKSTRLNSSHSGESRMPSSA